MGEKRAYKARKPGGGRKKLKPEYNAGENLKEQQRRYRAMKRWRADPTERSNRTERAEETFESGPMMYIKFGATPHEANPTYRFTQKKFHVIIISSRVLII